jgi:YD repeat-containing protein
VQNQLNTSLSVVPGFSTKNTMWRDGQGNSRKVVNGVVAIGQTSYSDFSEKNYYYDEKGYLESVKESDKMNSSSRDHVIAAYDWNGGVLGAMTDSSGVVTSYTYDKYDRVKTSTRNQITGVGSHLTQVAITTTYSGNSGSTFFSDRNYGWQNQTTTTQAGSITLTSSTERDERGRINKTTDENGYITTYDINPNGTSTVITYPNLATSTTTTYLDGRHQSTTGTAAIRTYTSHSLSSTGEMTTTEYIDTNGNSRKTERVTNMLGQTLRMTSPARSGGNPIVGGVTTTNHYQSGTGYLVRVSSNAANVSDTVIEYNTIGVLTGQGQSQDTSLTSASDDRITDLESGVELDGSALWSFEKTYIYPTLSSATRKRVSTSRTQLAGFTGNIMARSESINIEGQLSYQQSELQLGAGGVPEGITTARSKVDVITSEAIVIAFYGRTEAAEIPGVTGLASYTHDALGRVIHTQDPRHTGNSDTVYKANSSQVEKVVNAKGEETTFTYYGQGALGAGRVSTTTLPDATSSYTAYDARSRTFATWGSQTYTRWYEYDDYKKSSPSMVILNGGNSLPLPTPMTRQAPLILSTPMTAWVGC